MKKNKTLCIIDDEPIDQFILHTLVKKINSQIKILSYLNPTQAFESLTQLLVSDDMPDIILLDINMPEMNGWQFLSEFVKIKPQIGEKIAIYILSSSTSLEDKDKAKNHKDISGYLSKPIEVSTLKEIMGGSSTN